MKRNEGQGAFDFEAIPVAPPPKVVIAATESPPGRKLDAEGWRWWASLARAKQEECIGRANSCTDVKEMGEWAGIAKTYKERANRAEARANCLEEGI